MMPKKSILDTESPEEAIRLLSIKSRRECIRWGAALGAGCGLWILSVGSAAALVIYGIRTVLQ